MKRITKILISCIMLLTLGACSIYDDDSMEVFGGNYVLRDNETLKGDLVFFGGDGHLEKGSIVEGDLLAAGADVYVDGIIKGDIAVFGSTINLSDSAEVKGSISSFGGSINHMDDAEIHGGIISAGSDIPGIQNDQLNLPLDVFDAIGPQLKLPISIFFVLLWAAFGALMVLIFPNIIHRISDTVLQQTILSVGVGFLAIVVGLVASITIILLPIICVLSPLFLIAMIFGKIGLGMALGRKLEPSINSSLSPAVIAGIGILIVELVSAFFDMIPCVGWTVGFLFSMIGLGAVIITLFESRNSPPRIG